MSGEAWLLLGTLVTAGGLLLGTWLTVRQQGRQTKTVDSQQLIDQLQEMRAADEERHSTELDKLEGRYLRELVEVRTEMTEVKGRVGRMEDRELVLQDYVASLRHHIDQGLGPPPPPWPDSLMHRT